jgi:hypothetical protein
MFYLKYSIEFPIYSLGYVYGLTAVFIVSALSLVGLLALPILYKVSFEYVLNFFTAIAIGTLFGDAMFHLFPYVCLHNTTFISDNREYIYHRSLVVTITMQSIIIMIIHHFQFQVINGKSY